MAQKKGKMTLVLRVFPEDALQILADLYKQNKLTEIQYLSKMGNALVLLNKKYKKKD